MHRPDAIFEWQKGRKNHFYIFAVCKKYPSIYSLKQYFPIT